LRDIVQLTKDAGIVSKDDVGTNVSESKLYGTSRSSYQKMENVRIIVRHNKPVHEEQVGARSRNIQKIFVETEGGERFLLPEGTTVNGARAYARHIKNGGTMLDEFGQHIGKIIKEMSDLKVFVRNMRGRTFEDTETNAMVEAAIDHYGALHRDLFTMRGQRGYAQYRELWQPDQMLQDDVDIEALKERFTRKVFDERLMDALPVVAHAYKTRKDRVGEEFESWANEIAEELESDDADNVKSPFANSVGQGGAGGSDIDSDSADDKLAAIFNEHGFDYKLMDGAYWFESKQEISRAKDILAQAGVDWNDIKFGVYDAGYGNGGNYGASGWEYEAPGGKGVSESINENVHGEAMLQLASKIGAFIEKKYGVKYGDFAAYQMLDTHQLKLTDGPEAVADRVYDYMKKTSMAEEVATLKSLAGITK
jgi:hypothetical protein